MSRQLAAYPPAPSAQATFERLRNGLVTGQVEPVLNELRQYSTEQRMTPLLAQLTEAVITYVAQAALERAADRIGLLLRSLGIIADRAQQLIFQGTCLHIWPNGDEESLLDGPLRRQGRERGQTACEIVVRLDKDWRPAEPGAWQTHPGLRCPACMDAAGQEQVREAAPNVSGLQPAGKTFLVQAISRSLTKQFDPVPTARQLSTSADSGLAESIQAMVNQALATREQPWQRMLDNHYLPLTIQTELAGRGGQLYNQLSAADRRSLIAAVWHDAGFGWPEIVIQERLAERLARQLPSAH